MCDGELDGAAASDAREHVTHCFRCRVEIEDWSQVSRLLRESDPVRPQASPRRRVLKEDLLRRCAASIQEAEPALPRSRALWPWSLAGGRPERRVAILAPAALAAILLLLLLVRAPRRERSSDVANSGGGSKPVVTLLGPPKPRVAKITAPRREATMAKAARREDAVEGKQRPGRAGSGDRVRRRSHRAPIPPRLVLSHPSSPHDPFATRRGPNAEPSARRVEGAGPGARRPEALTPWETHGAPAARVVIQVDPPRPAPTTEATHITIIAEGDPSGPNATLAIVRSDREEVHP